MFVAVKTIGNIMLVTMLFNFLFAVIGVQLFKVRLAEKQGTLIQEIYLSQEAAVHLQQRTDKHTHTHTDLHTFIYSGTSLSDHLS